MQLEVVAGDITRQRVDAVVNAANRSLLGGAGVDGAIHAVGGPQILAECRELRRTVLPDGLATGAAVATGAGRLPARWVIHTVGPVYAQEEDPARLLAAAYHSCVQVAADLGARSLAFPAVSAGAYGYPLAQAAEVAVQAVRQACAQVPGAPPMVRFVVFGPAALAAFTAAEGAPRPPGR